MSIVTLLPFIVLIGAMFLMTRSAKKKQQAAAQMRNEMQPGTGVRTIGGMYATVKEIGDETVLLEVAPGVHAVYAKNAIGAVLEDSEYNRIVHGDDEESDAETVVPDDASSLTEAAEATDKDAETVEDAPKADLTKKSDAAETGAEGQKDGKADGETDAK
ncbi:preprotein translocase subunit YajC [Streptomyces tanashiensis]|uniref:Preprotein translocase subunit YajC n=1 Tax=Streptomyces tanashiensis TaxID=67367 RepID=A0ABY6R4R5_9ACTN|nr:preprotein translocase subunit YajC [Streptomyces tanashiensis]UZX25043.1 preprotein translocase subunit YajC [Streptomyces tanashiensis]GGY23497.1 preprotein translocase subunit YajC [Streptomyces tanashiensis]